MLNKLQANSRRQYSLLSTWAHPAGQVANPSVQVRSRPSAGRPGCTTLAGSTNASAFSRSSVDSATMVWPALRSMMCRLCMFTPACLNFSATFANAPGSSGSLRINESSETALKPLRSL